LTHTPPFWVDIAAWLVRTKFFVKERDS